MDIVSLNDGTNRIEGIERTLWNYETRKNEGQIVFLYYFAWAQIVKEIILNDVLKFHWELMNIK